MILSCGPDSTYKGYDEPDEPYTDIVFRDVFNADAIDTIVWQVASWEEYGEQTGTERCYTSGGYLHLVFINDSVRVI